MARSTLTVFFENPFWVGVYERIDGDRYEVCKITFGAEPKDYEVWDFLLKNWSKLKFSPTCFICLVCAGHRKGTFFSVYQILGLPTRRNVEFCRKNFCRFFLQTKVNEISLNTS